VLHRPLEDDRKDIVLTGGKVQGTLHVDSESEPSAQANLDYIGMRTARVLAAALWTAWIALALPFAADAFPLGPLAPLVKHAQAFSEEAIERLAKIASRPGGPKELGRELGQQQLPEVVRSDAYARIAIAQGKVERQEALRMINRLGDVPGFGSTLSKIIGPGDAMTRGHLNELRIAYNAQERGFEVRGIGMRFTDPNKGAPTDIDVVLARAGHLFAVEAKDYDAQTRIPMDTFRADMNTLVEYVRQAGDRKVIPVFSITHQPAEQRDFALLRKEAERRGIELIVGPPEAQARLILQLVRSQ
jgi:hypothetical protein